ncbi:MULTISPECIES: ribbon-helix-helix domain-containing protein [Sphingobium]|jgi:antitoxin ParD1/3/4|uniref:ribbon-helix-helix domain-containing protein n=1 Tax=Sphingobium TaxID=165695 RepID=UPI0010CA80FC|nr:MULTISPECIES: type II toxin-antitoxin system ParD family antitoxin [Sphingobium]TKV43474.1 CopG family transcriptional regulator [Sphingobium sp. MP9-4]
MRTPQQFNVTLRNDMAVPVRAKAVSGEYASESEVIRDGLRAFQALETWLRDEVVPGHDAYQADPSRRIPLEEVRAGLAERHERTANCG